MKINEFYVLFSFDNEVDFRVDITSRSCGGVWCTAEARGEL